MIFHNAAQRTVLVSFAVCASLLSALPARGQSPPPKQDEIKAVARISKKLIENVAARKEVVAAIPYNAIVLGFHCQGVIDGRANLSVDMTTSQGEATFVVNGRGTAHTYVRGVRGPIVALGPAWSPFTSRTVVRFDGRKSSVVGTTPWAQVHGELECVEGRHGEAPGAPSASCSFPSAGCWSRAQKRKLRRLASITSKPSWTTWPKRSSRG